MIIKHSFNYEKPTISELIIGEIVASFKSKKIYTKSLNSNVINVGNSKHNLAEFDIYQSGDIQTKTNNALVQFKLIEGVLKLTTTLPFIYLSNFSNTLLDNVTYTTNSYLGVNSNNQLLNTITPEFNLKDLGDISNLNLNSSVDKFALTSLSSGTPINFNKDSFISSYYITWSLLPEINKFIKLDDVNQTTPQIHNIARIVQPGEHSNYLVSPSNFSIAYDTQPSISNNIDANGKQIYNQNYLTQTKILTNTVESILCDCNTYAVFRYQCNTNVDVLNVTFSLLTDFTETNLVPIVLVLNNFNGLIKFLNNIQYENGITPTLLGTEHILNCLVSNTSSGIKITVLQRATNLTKTI